MMNKKFFLFSVFCFFILSASNACAYPNLFFSCTGRESIVGTIEGLQLNTMDILDEQDKELKSFVYFCDRPEHFQKGDQVRIYFRCRDGFIESIKKMTPVKYKKDGQNAGYILKNSASCPSR